MQGVVIAHIGEFSCPSLGNIAQPVSDERIHGNRCSADRVLGLRRGRV
jgi:hypothetical protein